MSEHQSTASQWEQHIEQAKNYPGSIKAYCQHSGIAMSSFYKWQKKLKKPVGKRVPPKPNMSLFAPVSVADVKTEIKDEFANPEWLARFASEFIRSLR